MRSDGRNAVNGPKLQKVVFLLVLDGERVWCSVVLMTVEVIEGPRFGEHIAARQSIVIWIEKVVFYNAGRDHGTVTSQILLVYPFDVVANASSCFDPIIEHSTGFAEDNQVVETRVFMPRHERGEFSEIPELTVILDDSKCP